jgi:SAM-dependent methyltransferase
VLATDIDTRFHAEPAANVTLLRHDIVREPLPRRGFDLVHARAVLQHLPEREAVLDTLVAAVRPGGALVIEESDFRAFEAQPLPEPYAIVHRLMNSPELTPWREPHFGSRLVALLHERGIDAIDVAGDSWAMRPGEPGGDWWFLAVERVLPQLQRAGLLDDAQVAAVRATITDPRLVLLSPLSLAVSGRVPS